MTEFHPEARVTHGYAMKISSMYHGLLIFYVKLNVKVTKIDGMGPFKPFSST